MPTFYTRWTPEAGGPYPLQIVASDDGEEQFRLNRGGAVETFNTWRSFIASVHGQRFVDRHWPKDRYLNRGHYGCQDVAGPGMAFVGPFVPEAQIIVGPSPFVPSERTRKDREGTKAKEQQAKEHEIGTISVHVPIDPKGIDLATRGHEVAKLLYAGFSSWIKSSGYDFEDVLQEVYRKILVSNHGKSPWDPNKSSFGHYVHLLCYSALSNYHRKQIRVREHTGVLGIGPDGTWQSVDVRSTDRCRWVGTSTKPDVDPIRDLQAYIANGPYRRHPSRALAIRLVPLIHEGHTLKSAADLLDTDRPSVSRAMKLLRQCASRWAN